jgi:hypothetical protein
MDGLKDKKRIEKTKGIFGSLSNLLHLTTFLCLRLDVQFERLTLSKV